MIEPFHVEIPSETIISLRERLAAVRWPVGVTENGGIPLSRMRSVVDYWSNGFDWAEQERDINRSPHFRAEIEGLHVHYIYLKSAYTDARPLLLLHGWPGSFVELLPLLPMLTGTFHIVLPSLPGYGFSDAPSSPGMSNQRIASLLAQLMSLLGYDRFAVQGGDWGAGIATWLAVRFPSRVTAMHLNYIPGSYAPFVERKPSDEEAGFLQRAAEWDDQDGAYGQIQRTRPLTLGYALSDSPTGLAAWIIEKFYEWADPRSVIPLDAILTNVTIYWATNTIASSMRLYLESVRTPLRFGPGEHIHVPCGIARFPYEMPFPPRRWVERAYDVVHWTEMPRGGHFAALEAPTLLAEDMLDFFRQTR